MRLINQYAVYLPQSEGITGIFQQIEAAARTCYKSEDKITDSSAEKMVKALINSGHTAMLEHGTVYLKFPSESETVSVLSKYDKYRKNPYSKVRGFASTALEDSRIYYYVTTNYRVIVENEWYDDLKYLCEPTSLHYKRYSVRCITNLQVVLELVRHRKFSFAQESSRYCNYSKEKFGNQLTFIAPCWNLTGEENELTEETWWSAMSYIEKSYFQSLKYGCSPQQAAQVLPKALKTEIVITGFGSDWKHFFDLRLFEKTGKVHPQMLELAKKIYLVLPKEAITAMNLDIVNTLS